MPKSNFLFIIVLLCLNAVIHAQLPHTFTNTAHIYDGGTAYDVAIGSDGTIFTANTSDGLRAYTYDDTSFTNTAHINTGGTAWGVAISSSGTIFLANGSDGLRAYTYNGTAFTNTAYINTGSTAWGVAVNSDGTVFIANSGNGRKRHCKKRKAAINFITVAPNIGHCSQRHITC